MRALPHEIFADHRPRSGDVIAYRGQAGAGIVTRVEGALCWTSYGGAEPAPFIWCFRDGLNNMHDWPAKAGGKVAP